MKKLLATTILVLFLVVSCATVEPKGVPEPYRVIFTTGLIGSKPKEPINDLTEVSINEKQIYIHVKWSNLRQKKYEYESKIYDGAGKLVRRGWMSFTSKKRSHNTWSRYRFNKHVDKPGKWRFEIYLDGEKLVDRSVTILPEP